MGGMPEVAALLFKTISSEVLQEMSITELVVH